MQAGIPAPIRSAIESGDAILFLGAGASYDSLRHGKPVRVYGDTVRDALSDAWLGGAHKKQSLMTVADFARSEASLMKVQGTVRSLFIDLEPAPFHLLIPTFRWRAIVTTNYDLVIEKAYASCKDSLQELSPVTRDGDELEKALSGQNTVPYLKLHGCITNYNDANVPIVLDSKEYSKFKSGRQNLVKTFAEWASRSPLIFCGYSLSDENIKELLFDIGDASQHRDAYLYVEPSFDEIQNRYWLQRRITPFENTFAGFLAGIDSQIPRSNRVLAALLDNNDLSILRWIPSHTKPSSALVQYLTEELFHVQPDPATGQAADARAFYCGMDVSFSPIYNGLDARRVVTDNVLERAVLDTMQSTLPKLFIIKGYAGAGKSVIAKRIAFETSALLDAPLVVWVKEGSVIRPDLLTELQSLVQSRLFIFIDDLIEHQNVFGQFIGELFYSSIPVTIVACARTNELNIYGQSFQHRVTSEFELQDLESSEVMLLLEKLSKAKILGPLEQYNEGDRKLFIEKFYGQQLLVALHEITFGDTFENIVVNEFENIQPREAKQLYLDICTLHQCGVGVRAGLLSRISSVPISNLDKVLSGPLARVIRQDYDHRYRDIVYRSRHPEIARMVFHLAIQDQTERSRQLVRMISMIDLDFSSDDRAFFELVKGRKLAGMFDRKELALDVFDAAEKTTASSAFIAHQRAILELNHPNGNFDVAAECLREASIPNPRDPSILHTKANLLRKRAQNSKTTLERERYRADARTLLKPQLGKREKSYPEHLYGQILLDEIKDHFSSHEHMDGANKPEKEAAIVRVINELTSLIDGHLRTKPGDGAMTLLRADFLRRVGEQPRAISVLERFHKVNPENSAISRVLAEALSSGPELGKAIEILRATVLIAPSDMIANLAFAKLLMRQDEEANADTILSCLRRAFADGDTHYEARMLYGRANMIYGDLKRGEQEFEMLKSVYIENRDKATARFDLAGGAPKLFQGAVLNKNAGFAFIKSPELRFNTYLRKSGVIDGNWAKIDRGILVTFTLAFSFRGPVAQDVAPRGDV